jgi:hypothetical protein
MADLPNPAELASKVAARGLLEVEEALKYPAGESMGHVKMTIAHHYLSVAVLLTKVTLR